MGLTNNQMADLLLQVDPRQPLGAKLHSALVRLTVSVAIEAVAFRESAEVPQVTEVLLRQRGPNEPAYAGQWHCPGSFIRPGEVLEDVFRRLESAETLGRVANARLVVNSFWPEERGTICSSIYLVRFAVDPEKARWFPVDRLPEPMVDHHRDMIIPTALRAYRDIR